MAAQKLHLTGENRIEQGSTYEIQITVRNADGSLYDLLTYTAAAQIRETKASATAIAFTASINTTTSVITLTMSAAVTAGITFTTGYWDCEITVGTTVIRILEGRVGISQEVTKA
ncbi:MAG TPA: hypothetical protein VLH56_17230 [Dissulfurispiraceae bacterium]|nr:hypothetical protein [Dissulfurispiraceae bacterium]